MDVGGANDDVMEDGLTAASPYEGVLTDAARSSPEDTSVQEAKLGVLLNTSLARLPTFGGGLWVYPSNLRFPTFGGGPGRIS